jgi:hypothetical protein
MNGKAGTVFMVQNRILDPGISLRMALGEKIACYLANFINVTF